MDFNKLWQNFMDQIQNHYMDFNGRLGMQQFWYFVLVCIGVQIVASIIDVAVTGGLIRGVIGLALALPTAGAAARRMQDSGRNGQLAWIWAIVTIAYAVLAILIGLSGPFGALAFLYFFFTIGWIVNLAMAVVTVAIIYFCIQPGQTGDNQFGPPPPVWTPN